MRLGFFVDGPLTCDKTGNIYGVAFNDKMFSRYFSFASELNLCMRVREMDNPEGVSQITLPNITFTPCINMSTINFFMHKNKAKKTIKKVLSHCDGAVIRLPGMISQVAIQCCKEMSIPYLIEMVGCPRDSLWNHSLKGKLIAYPIMLRTKQLIYEAPAILYVTNKFLQDRYPNNGINIGCSDVELHEVDDIVLQNRLQKINHHARKLVIGTTAAVNVKYKGQQYIIEALGVLKRQGIIHFEYQMVGNGDQDFLKFLARKFDVVDQIKFLGGLPHEKVFDWLDSIDIYVQPSRQEGLPRALVEAMSRGLPSFGAEIGGIPELLDKECMFSNTRKNITEISSILRNFNQQTMTIQAKKNFKKAEEYHREKLEDKRTQFYKEYFSKGNNFDN